MKAPKPHISLGLNASGDPVYCIETNGFLVFNPHFSECGRFTVHCLEEYGILPSHADGLHRLNIANGYDDSL